MSTTYSDLRVARISTRRNIAELQKALNEELEALGAIEKEIGHRYPKKKSPSSLRKRVAKLLSTKSWQRKREWTRQDIQALPEFTGESPVSMNVLLAELCKEKLTKRLRTGCYTCV